MTQLTSIILWNALEASVLAVVVAFVLRLASFRPSGVRPSLRSALWLLVLLKLVMPPWVGHSLGLSGACATVTKTLASWSPRPTKPERPLDDSRASIDTLVVRPGGADVVPVPMASPGVPAPDPPGAEEPGTTTGVSPALSAVLPTFEPDAVGGKPARAARPAAAGEVHAAASLPVAATGDTDAPAVSSGDPGQSATPPVWRPVDVWLAVWLAGAFFVLLRQVRRIVAFEVVLRRAAAAEAPIVSVCRRVAARLGMRRAPRVVVLPGNLPPMVWALCRPIVVLPAPSRTAREEVLSSVLAHELAHLKRRDHWVSWLELVESCVFWWLPTFWLARREFRESADQAADGLAVAAVGCRVTYAESLMETVDSLQGCVPVPLAYGMGEKETLVRRLTMIMRDPLRPRLSWCSRVAVALLAFLALPASPARLVGQQSDPKITRARVVRGSAKHLAGRVEAISFERDPEKTKPFILVKGSMSRENSGIMLRRVTLYRSVGDDDPVPVSGFKADVEPNGSFTYADYDVEPGKTYTYSFASFAASTDPENLILAPEQREARSGPLGPSPAVPYDYKFTVRVFQAEDDPPAVRATASWWDYEKGELGMIKKTKTFVEKEKFGPGGRWRIRRVNQKYVQIKDSLTLLTEKISTKDGRRSVEAWEPMLAAAPVDEAAQEEEAATRRATSPRARSATAIALEEARRRRETAAAKKAEEEAETKKKPKGRKRRGFGR